MRQKTEIAVNFTKQHPEALIIAGGVFLAFLSVFTAQLNVESAMFVGILSVSLMVIGVVPFVLQFWLRLLTRLGNSTEEPLSRD